MSPSRTVLPALFWAVVIAFAIAFALYPVLTRAQAALPFTQQDCKNFAEYIERAGDIRDLEANVEKHVRLIKRKNADLSRGTQLLLEREIRRLYARPGFTPEQLGQEAYVRCMVGELGAKES